MLMLYNQFTLLSCNAHETPEDQTSLPFHDAKNCERQLNRQAGSSTSNPTS
jgi:hypothetical protein